MDIAIKTKVESFFAQYKPQVYKKGELLIQPERDPAGVFYLKKGIVRQYALSQNGDELVVNMFKEGVFFPMSWAINQNPNIYFFEAVASVEVQKAPREKIIAFIKQNPDVLYDLLSRVYRGTDGLLTRMVYLMGGSAYKRLITEMLIFTKRFGIQKPSTAIFSCEISEIELAAQAGMTRETVSREIHKLKEKGLITFSKNVLVILDMQKLEEELADDF